MIEAAESTQPDAQPRAGEATVVSTEVLPEVIKQLLEARGYSTPEQIDAFLRPDYDRDLADPFLMTDMNKAVDRILLAAQRNEKVVVYGDYDVDGVSSSTLMLEVLATHGIEAEVYIPDRFTEGYGVHQEALEQLKAEGAQLIVTVDCGITAAEAVRWANDNGLDVVVTDHHEPPAEIPDAAAVVNPHREGDQYPFKDLAGVGVVFAVARALQKQTGVPAAGQEKWWLDLVALGTVCDVMPLVGENRVLVKYGLLVLKKTRRVGLVALSQAAGFELDDIRAYHLGYIVGPRLNAAGRMEHAARSLELLRSDDPGEAQTIAYELEDLNSARQLDQKRILAEADTQAELYADDPVLVLLDPEWSHGIVGIVASKLAEKWQKPVLLLQRHGDSAKGSGRSAQGYNLIEGLTQNRHLFTKVGGHEYAAGFSLDVANVDELRDALNEHYLSVEHTLTGTSRHMADAALQLLDDANWDLHYALQRLEPFGNANPQPILGAINLKLLKLVTMGRDKTHVRVTLADNSTGAIMEAVGFGMAEQLSSAKPGQSIEEALFSLEVNEFKGERKLQLRLLELR